MSLFPSPSGFWLALKIPTRTLYISIKLGPKYLNLQCRSTFRKPDFQEQSTIANLFLPVLETCPDIESVRKIHARILTCGHGNSVFLGSKLLNCYASFDSSADSRRVFEKIIDHNLPLWNSNIVAYFRTGHFSEVLWLYSSSKEQRIGIDSLALTFSLKSCVELGNVDFGRAIHGDVFKLKLNGNRFVCSSLISLYSKCGLCIEDARQVFEDMMEKDVVAYTAMITAHSQMSDIHCSEAFRIASYMQKDGVYPNRVTLVSLLQAVAKLECLKEGKSVHCYAIRRGYVGSDEILETSLIDMYIKCGALNMAASFFDRTVTRTVASLNVMIAGFVRSGRASEALYLFYLMKQGSHEPDSITVANVLMACSDLKNLQLGMSVHGYIIRAGICLDLVTITSLINMYSKCKSINEARELFNLMKVKDVILYNVMISGYVQSGLVNEAIKTFSGLVKAGIRPNAATVLNMLSMTADLTDVRKGRWIHGFIVRHGLEMTTEVANQIVHMYMQCGHIVDARLVFNDIKDKDLVAWTSMMMGYVHHGYADEALSIFRLMQGAGEEPDSVTLLCLLQAFSQLGCMKQAKEIHGYVNRFYLEKDLVIINSLVLTYAKCGRIDMAKVLFNNMSERDLTSWNTMITAYGMHGNCLDALSLFHQMVEQNFEPDELTFTSLLFACSHAGLVEEGQRIFSSMTAKHFITPCDEHYACMVDLLGRAGRLEEAYDFVKLLPVKDNASAWGALLAACRIHRNTQLGEEIGSKLLDLEPENSSAYKLVLSIYAEAGKWNEVARIRKTVREKGLRKMPGYSLIEFDKHVYGI